MRMRLFLTPEERLRTASTAHSQPGLVVRLMDGTRYFFPGGDQQQAETFAKQTLGERLTEPLTAIEWGSASGSSWTCERVIKAPGIHHASD